MSEKKEKRHMAKKREEGYLGTPFLEDFSENTLRIRRNLFIASTLVLIYKVGKLKPHKDATILGIKFDFKEFPIDYADTVLLFILSYLLLHFLVSSWSQFWEWKIRLTGVWEAVDLGWLGDKSMGASYHHEAPNNHRQASLLTWFQYHIVERGMYAIHAKTLEDNIKEFVEGISKDRRQNLYEDKHISNFVKRLSSRSEIENAYLAQLETRLTRFHKSFFQFQFFQVFRLFVLEWGLPVFLGIWAIVLLMR